MKKRFGKSYHLYHSYCWWFRNPAHQLRLVVYPIICRDIPGGAGFLPSTVVINGLTGWNVGSCWFPKPLPVTTKTKYINVYTTRWWFQTFYFHPYLGKISNLTDIFQMAWNHQLDKMGPKNRLYIISPINRINPSCPFVRPFIGVITPFIAGIGGPP